MSTTLVVVDDLVELLLHVHASCSACFADLLLRGLLLLPPRTAVHMAARAAGSEMLAVLLDALPEQERTDLINTADRSGITAVFLAFQRWVGGGRET
jgi:hypothetical protein